MRGWRVVADDVVLVADRVRERVGAPEVHTLGISLGAVFALAAAIRRPGLFTRHVLLAPGFRSAVHVPLARRIEVAWRSSLTPRRMLELPFGLEHFTERVEWREALAGDTLRTREVTARFLFETFRLQRFVCSRIERVREPVFALLAGADGVVDNEAVLSTLPRASSRRVRIEVFEEASHVLAASVPRAQLVARLAAWYRGEILREEDPFQVRRTARASWQGEELAVPPDLGR
jgi:alpha-beta hydrolase superfamily lysophospholipase